MKGITIQETRHLTLPLQTVLDAVVQYDQLSHGDLLGGKAMEAQLVRGNPREQGLRVAVRSSSDGVIDWKHLDTDLLSRAIISFCRSRRIPLPFAAEKTLTITEQGASLAIENTLELSRRAAIEHDISGQPLRYARGYEPHAILPRSRSEVSV